MPLGAAHHSLYYFYFKPSLSPGLSALSLSRIGGPLQSGVQSSSQNLDARSNERNYDDNKLNCILRHAASPI